MRDIGKICLKKYTYVQKCAYLQLSSMHINTCKKMLITLSEIQDIIIYYIHIWKYNVQRSD